MTEHSFSAFSPDWLSDPRVFSVNRLSACSDHAVYADAEEADRHSSSLVRSLNGTWLAHFATNPSLAPDKLLTDGTNDNTLREITVPGVFQMQNPEWDTPHYVNTQYPWDGWEELTPPQVSTEYNPTVTAVRRFTLNEKDLDCGRIVLTFHAVEAACAVWLNGQFIGYAEDSFTPHRFDITAAAVAGENRLVARVFKRCTGSWLEDQDFWRFSGIQRDVTLTFEPKTHLADIFVHTPLTDNYTRATVEAEMQIDRPCGTVSAVLSFDGEIIGSAECEAAGKVNLSIPVPSPKLWSGETPDLYTLTVTLLDDEKTVNEVSRLKVGIREFKMDNRVMKLNGKRIVFHGVNRHEFNCDTGRVVTEADILRDLQDMRAMNINAIRTCHYPNHSALYRLCDEYGFYLIDETNIEAHGAWKPAHDWLVPGSHPDWLDMTLDRGRSMLERDKNHACILIWSCGNEASGGSNLLALSNFFRKRDPSRIVHYENVWNLPEWQGTTDVYSMMYGKVSDIEAYLAKNPDKPFINCEYTHAMGNSCGGITLYQQLEDKYEMYQGGFIWDWQDQGLRSIAPNGKERLAYGGDFGDRPNDRHFNTNGLLLGDRTPTGKVQEVRYAFREADLIPDANGVTIRSRRLFTDFSDCELAWSTQLDGKVTACGKLPCPASLTPGETVYLPVDWQIPAEKGEVSVTCRLVNRADKLLRVRGQAVAVGQAILRERILPEIAPANALRTAVCDYNAGARGGSVNVMFSRDRVGQLGMDSMKDAAGQEMMLHPPRPSLFRAPNDNDIGNGDNVLNGIWHMFSSHCHDAAPEIVRDESGMTVTYHQTHPLLPGVSLDTAWECRSDDAVRVTVTFHGAAGLPSLPALGLSFQLDSRLNHVRYYGMGPDEAYCDRCGGATLGRWNYEVKDGWTRYAKPQESGNRMGVREMDIVDAHGHGLRVLAEEQPLEISVQPYLPEELMNKWHPEELQGSCRTVLDIAMFRKGIGGDDSWGAPVLPQYTYPSDKTYTFSFLLRAI